MKKLKLNLSSLKGAEVLSREQLKKVIGGDYGYGGKGCITNADCALGYKCVGIPGKCGGSSTANQSCKSDADCGNGLKCRSFTPPMSGTYCGL